MVNKPEYGENTFDQLIKHFRTKDINIITDKD